MKIHNVALTAAALALALPTAASAKNITLKYLTAWDKRYIGTPLIAYDYGKMVEKPPTAGSSFNSLGRK